jgi:beta-barrel assembly-enhancing protease
MNKLTLHGLLILVIFFFTWFSLSEVDWMNLLRIEKLSTKTEEKLGEVLWDWFNNNQKEIENSEVLIPVDSIISRICESNDFRKDQIKLHIVKSDEINAFALPDQHLVIYSGLITASENESELCGVICHELAHMKMKHVTKKLVKEIGLSALFSIAAGNKGGEIIAESAKLLSSTAYDRKLEKEADIKAVDFMIESEIKPEYFARFLSRLAENDTLSGPYVSWVNTHPDSKKRSEYILDYRKGEPSLVKPILSEGTWIRLKESVKN